MLHFKTAASTLLASHLFRNLCEVCTPPCGVAAPYGAWRVVWGCCGADWFLLRAGDPLAPCSTSWRRRATSLQTARSYLCAPCHAVLSENNSEAAAADGRIGTTCLSCNSSLVSICGT